jgi:hypothetical protein
VLHHLNGFEWDIEGRYDPGNCVLIHQDIHYMFHGIYKCRMNTIEQIEAFLKIYYPEAPIPWIDEQFQLSMTLEDAIVLINKHRDFFYTELERLATSRNHLILNGKYENTKSEFEMQCLTHNVFFTIVAKQYKSSEFRAPCCIKEQKVIPALLPETIETDKLDSDKYTFQQNQRLEGYEAFQHRLVLKNHELQDGEYVNNTSKVTIFCPTHNKSFVTTPDNHEKSSYGLPCCEKAGQAQTVETKNLEELQHLTALRKHEISCESLKDYKTQDTKLTFNCLIHNKSFITTRRIYKRSKFGLQCCKDDPKILPVSSV